MSQVDKRPSPEVVQIRTGPFPESGLLPTSYQDRRNNELQRSRDENAEKARRRRRAAEGGPAYSSTSCTKSITISLFFDGTNNHEPSDREAKPPNTSNIARLFHATMGLRSGDATDIPSSPGSKLKDQGLYRYYIPGVGTRFPEIGELTPMSSGLIFANGGEDRINWGLTRVIHALRQNYGLPPLPDEEAKELITTQMRTAGSQQDGYRYRKDAMQPHLEALTEARYARPMPQVLGIRLFVYGFSRGAAEARVFARWLEALTRPADAPADAVDVQHTLIGIPISIRFMGLFDTVATVGLANSLPMADGHMAWASDSQLRLSDNLQFLEQCQHFVAAHEQRASFPLDSIRRRDDPKQANTQSRYRAGCVEILYPGVHSDVGGGYSVGEQGKGIDPQRPAIQWMLLSQIPLHDMYRTAFEAGAPLQVPPLAMTVREREQEVWRQMSTDTQDEFYVSPELITRFNAWLEQAQPGGLEDVLRSQIAWITGWRIHRWIAGSRCIYEYEHDQARQDYFKRCDGKDQPKPLRQALEREHGRQLQEDLARRDNKPPLTLSPEQQKQLNDDRELIAKAAAGKPIPDGGKAKDGSEQMVTRPGVATRVNIDKGFEPVIDQQQLEHGAKDFRKDYVPEWQLSGDPSSIIDGVLDLALGGTVYLLNSDDEAAEYASIRESGQAKEKTLFGQRELRDLVLLYDEHIHDSRAWFIYSTLGTREPWTDYFRYRTVFYDDESNKPLSPLMIAGRVVGLAVTLGSVGFAIKRKDPRYLLGLMLPSLGLPVLSGRGWPQWPAGALPELSFTDPQSGAALPMAELDPALRAFSQRPAAAETALRQLWRAEPRLPVFGAEPWQPTPLMLRAWEARKQDMAELEAWRALTPPHPNDPDAPPFPPRPWSW
ncbi:T6SS phospholipase effector Tle1-like catalytic domain-containing protein [Chromobacterium haemolyticum]|uniref:T6SS phospholipase effector Tle1-like catalytic domain-containing protein n=1 Tax=Chromobacterium haemolyticum TaxID=394935 RepID=UPI00174646AB|nr:DUF2235 domain-containing protein [Chromobacterium haemolyticum]QOD81306.1 DUF2235 domain-containing protein [Chromobacterium haemolyticum]